MDYKVTLERTYSVSFPKRQRQIIPFFNYTMKIREFQSVRFVLANLILLEHVHSAYLKYMRHYQLALNNQINLYRTNLVYIYKEK